MDNEESTVHIDKGDSKPFVSEVSPREGGDANSRPDYGLFIYQIHACVTPCKEIVLDLRSH